MAPSLARSALSPPGAPPRQRASLGGLRVCYAAAQWLGNRAEKHTTAQNKGTDTRGLPPAPRRALKCALLKLAPWLGCGGVYSDVGSALGGVLCPALAPSQAPPLVRRTQHTPYALTFATTWLSPTSLYTLPLAHPLALATPSGLQPLGESGSGLQPAVVFIGGALIPCGSGAACSLHGSGKALRFTCAR